MLGRLGVEDATKTQIFQSADNGTSANQESTPQLKCVIQLLDQDARPSFIVDRTERHSRQAESPPVIYYNSALDCWAFLKQALLKNSYIGPVKHEQATDFWQWIAQRNRNAYTRPEIGTYLFHGIIWTATKFQEYLILSGLPEENVLQATTGQNGHLKKNALKDTTSGSSLQDNISHVINNDVLQIPSQSKDESGVSVPDKNTPDIDTKKQDVQEVKGVMARHPRSPHMQFFYTIDWASTRLGAMYQWSDELHQMCALIMADSEGAFLFWGDDYVVLHNEAAGRFFPHMRTSLMGSTTEKVFPQMWTSFASVFAAVRNSRQAVLIDKVPMLLDRRGHLKECYTSNRYTPVEDRAGNFLGIHQTIRNITQEVLSQRRLATLLEVSTCSNQVVETKIFWRRLLHALSYNKEDVGFALIYSLQNSPRGETDFLDRESRRVCLLEGLVGISEQHVGATKSLDLDYESTGYSPGLRRAFKEDIPVLLEVEDGTLPPEYVADVECRGFSSPCHAAVICPIRPTGRASVVGFLIIGLSSRITYDHEFRQFVDILNRQIATSMASMALYNDEIDRERKRAEQAALVHTKLQERLKQKTQALLTSEAKFERLTDSSPVGISITDATGNITYANNAWYKITGHSGVEVSADSWIAAIHEDDVHLAITAYSELLTTKKDVSLEFRLKKEWVREIDGAEPIRTATWVLVSAYIIEEDETCQAKSIFGALTDISAQKWAEETHRRRMVEALELKAQQESFIDTISHEMRNPLSAVLQSVDEVAEYLLQLKINSYINADLTQSSIEAVETIALCCLHQRRVIDDVLTLSKMNTDMLVIAFDENDPIQVVTNAVKMFSGDARKQDISLAIEVEESVRQMEITRLSFDASRMSQVLVNLLGNAIKFTRDSAERRIKVSIGTSISRPQRGDHGVEYVKPVLNNNEIAVRCGSKPDERVYLRIVVQDTGVGMTEDEKKRMFKRFSQASPRTHVQYGGSGLGLFISKKLTELQGGAVGLRMEDHQGTTFAFYVATLRAREDGRIANPSESGGLHNGVAAYTSSEVHDVPISTAQLKPHLSNTDYTLLVVEDNLVNQKVICKQLRKQGFSVYAASNGLEALDFLKKTNFWKNKEEPSVHLSLILLDIEMPVMDGLTCIRQIRQWEVEGVLNAHVPVISVSANARREQVQEAKLAGMDDNIPKPFRITDLIPVMEPFLSQA